MSPPNQVIELVERFDHNLAAYRSPEYNETQLRVEFLDPFFEALGWDIHNRQGYAEPYKDVIHEFSLKLGEAVKAPDYCFRIGGQPKFYVEAKRPAVNIKDDPNPAYQLRRYAWSSKLPLSILTDFEEFAVYDTRVTPAPADKPSSARVRLLRYTEYADHWDFFRDTFSPEAIRKGSFDKYVESTRLKRGTAEVDNAFLREIETWRAELARNLALRNHLSQRELNFAVQRTIDRIIFLRICEDRGIEPYGQLRGLLAGANLYQQLCVLFQRADDRYNSGLFHFQQEAGRAEEFDRLTLSLKVDDKVLRDIFRRLYYPDSPYEFSVLPADILGQVYEQFLGKVIRLTAGGHARVEDKPEVKKAGGVYYTPTYIVDYIVKNTVGKLVEGKTPRQVSKFRILDPACGSGSFLLGAYQFLLDWHRDRYVEDGPEKHKKELYQGPRGEWRLSTTEKKRILLNNIYGVDIDSQAVEVTKLSLLLKVLEGESEHSLAAQLRLFHERALPDLGRNIKCGNSLIGPDFYQHQQMQLLSDDERYRINVFDWTAEFKEIMEAGGFDAVIGNPPYGSIFRDAEKDYISRRFKAYQYKFDSYIYFVERALYLARTGGFVSFITPHLWLDLESCAPLRQLVAGSADFSSLHIWGEGVFKDAVVNTSTFLLIRGSRTRAIDISGVYGRWSIPVEAWRSSKLMVVEYRLPPLARSLVNKIERASKVLADFGDAIQGITPYDKYAGQPRQVIESRLYHADKKRNRSYGKWLAGSDVTRYRIKWSGEWLSYGPWLAAPRDPQFFSGERLLFREVPGAGKRIQAALAQETFYHGHPITPFKPRGDGGVDIRVLLAVANSRLLSWYAALRLPNFAKDIFPKLNPQDVKTLPIPGVLPRSGKEPALVQAVDVMAQLNSRVIEAGQHELTALERQIDALDQQIDRLVYQLYELTPEEIALVEAATQPAARSRAASAE